MRSIALLCDDSIKLQEQEVKYKMTIYENTVYESTIYEVQYMNKYSICKRKYMTSIQVQEIKCQ